MSNLNTLVEKALAAWPQLAYRDGGSRAESAADLVGTVRRMGEDQFGVDDRHIVTLRGGSCTCQDRAPLDANGKPLCKHRLAVMFWLKLQGDPSARFDSILANAQNCVLEVRVYFAQAGNMATYRLTGYRRDGEKWQRVTERAEEMAFGEADFTAALERHGWSLRSKLNLERHTGGRQQWCLTPADERAGAVAALRGIDAEQAEQRTRRTAEAERWERQLEARADALALNGGY